MTELKLNVVVDNLNKLKQNLESIVIGKKSSGGKSKDKGGKGGGIGKLAFLAGGILGFLAGIFTSMQSVTALLEILGSLLNMLIAPFVPILVGLLKPVLIVLQLLMAFMLQFFQDPVGALKDLFSNLGEVVGKLLGMSPEEINSFVANLMTIINNIVTVFKAVWNFLKAFFEGDFSGMWAALKVILAALWEIFKAIFLVAWDLLKGILRTVWGLLKKVFIVSWNFLKTLLVGVWILLKNIFIGGWNALKLVFTTAWEGLKTILSLVWDGLKGAFKFGVVGIAKIFDWLINNFTRGIKRFANLFISGLNKLIELINKISVVKIRKVSKFDTSVQTSNLAGFVEGLFNKQQNAGLAQRTNNTSININIEGSADKKTVNMMADLMRREITRRGAF